MNSSLNIWIRHDRHFDQMHVFWSNDIIYELFIQLLKNLTIFIQYKCSLINIQLCLSTFFRRRCDRLVVCFAVTVWYWTIQIHEHVCWCSETQLTFWPDLRRFVRHDRDIIVNVKVLDILDSAMFLCRHNQVQTSFWMSLCCHHMKWLLLTLWIFTSGGCFHTSRGENTAESRTLTFVKLVMTNFVLYFFWIGVQSVNCISTGKTIGNN